MAAGDAASTDVPGKYDVVLAGKGYVFADSVEPSLPFRNHRAIYDITPTFVQRSNVSNSYGDNAQDFFLTARQRDWSLGEQQKFFRSGQDGRYWMGQNVDVSIAGQVTLARAASTVTLASATKATCRFVSSDPSQAAVATTTNGYTVDSAGTITGLGVHGLGAAPSRYAMCTDLTYVYLSTTTAGTVGVRNYASGSYATFSATSADSLAFLNNTLFGYAAGKLMSYDTAGTATTLFTWKDGHGTAGALEVPRLIPYGGKLLIAFPYAQESSELWIYDGSGTSRLEVFPENFIINDIEVLYGVAYISGSFVRGVSGGNSLRPAVLFFDGSQVGKLWQASTYNPTAIVDASRTVGPHPSLGILEGRLVFPDETTGNFMAYDPASGGVSSIGTYTPNAGDSCLMSSSIRLVLHIRNQTTAYYFPAAGYPSTGYVISSLIDFESSLTKQFRGIKVDWAAASDGDGGSVDIAYQIDSLDGSWTTLKTGAVSGTEYTFTNISGHAIAVKVTINKGTSTAGPTLKSMNLRAAPVLKQFRSGLYVIDCTGSPDAPRELRDGSFHPLVPFDQVKNLLGLAQTTTPFTVTDRMGTFTALVDLNDPEGFDIYEEHPSVDNPEKSGSYLVRVKVREV